MLFRFQEIKKKDKVAAMQFLQTSVSELIDHSNIEQTREVSQICYKTNQKLIYFCFIFLSKYIVNICSYYQLIEILFKILLIYLVY